MRALTRAPSHRRWGCGFWRRRTCGCSPNNPTPDVPFGDKLRVIRQRVLHDGVHALQQVQALGHRIIDGLRSIRAFGFA
jgi:hypothetical protein